MKKYFIIILSLLVVSCSKDGSLDSLNSNTNTGQNGSITRFVIQDNFMYAIDFNYLKIFDISNNDNPVFISSVKVGYGLETIFIYDKYIYLGANDGVYVISVDNPVNPVQLQKIEHHISCDPVVVQGNYAYSTQRVNVAGCGTMWQISSLAVYDVTDPEHSTPVAAINMNQPYGLAVQGNWLYVCDPGKGGIVVFDITNPASPVKVAVAQVTEPRDIILMFPYMVVSTSSKFELYNYSDPMNIYLISTLVIS